MIRTVWNVEGKRRAGAYALAALGLFLWSPPALLHAQTGSAATTLLEKAHTLEARQRMDMASQTWQQVLLVDPNNTEALGGLARAAKLGGNDALADTYLQRLRAINPNDPGIARAEGIQPAGAQSDKLAQAGKLAESGNYVQAMNIYRQVFGGNPPPGDWALAYYETESATDSGKAHAIAGLRALIDKFPDDTRYQVTLGRILTYNPRTRAEGRRWLERHPSNPQAAEALRQSLVWDAQNPATVGEAKAYLKKHPDAELASAVRIGESNAERARRGAAAAARAEVAGETYTESPENAQRREDDAEMAAAYGALNSKNFEEAEARFKTILAKSPNNARALAGMGYVRMNQANFGGAISFMEQAKQEGSTDRGLDTALSTSRFWYTMGEGSIALNENDLTTAEKDYRAALSMRPSSPEAMEGLAGTLMKAQEPEAAIPIFDQYTRVKPASSAAWRGLFMAQYQAGRAALALATEKRLPQGVRVALMRDPEYLRTLASAYSAVGRDADAQRVLHSALELPFPGNGQGLKLETQLQYAALLQQANHLDQAEALYRQVLAADSGNTPAWEGLVRILHAGHSDSVAQQTLESMPPSAYEQAMRDPGFVTTVASIYQTQNKLDVAQQLLEKAIADEQAAGQKVAPGTLIQLAGIYLLRNDAQRAYPIYRQVLLENPDRVDAWKGLLSSLHTEGHDREALAQIQQIPLDTRKHLETDVDYLQTVGSIYNGLNESAQAMVFLNRVKQKYASSNAQAPADIDIQNAYLLFNGQNDTGLYRQLMVLGSRNDLTDDQRRTVQTIWAMWAVRRANQAAAMGYVKRPLAILNAAARAFPDNPGVLRALAGGYLHAGMPKQAVDIFKAQDMTTGSAGDYKAAVGAAIAANDTKDAETWLRFGLTQYPRDSQMLTLAAKFEQARGDNSRAVDYYHASLSAMPPPDPGAELADELSRPTQAMRPMTVAQQQDLAQLLAPGSDMATGANGVAMQEQSQQPYLPSYTNNYGQAPVMLNGQQQNIVPQYMVNPAYQQQMQQRQQSPEQTTMRPGRPSNMRLGDYVPQASNQDPGMMPGVDISNASAVASTDPSVEYQREQIRLLTQQAQGTSYPGAVVASNGGDVYGPYVPYIAPGMGNATPMFNAVASQVVVSPTVAQGGTGLTSETTDVLPSTHYVPNAKARRSGRSSHPEIAAAEAAEIRRNQSNRTDRLLSNVPTNMMGQSTPSDDVDVAPLQSTQYVPSGNQMARPSSLPANGTTGGDSYRMTNQFGPNPTMENNATSQTNLTLGQQYPRPNGRVTSSRGPAPRRVYRRAAQAPSTTPGPAYAPLYYPAVPNALTSQGYPTLGQPVNLGTAPSDAQLVQRNLPPLRGYYDPNPREVGPPLTERQQAELDLNTLEGSYSGWVGGLASLRFRSGTPGIDRLFDYEGVFEASIVAAKAVRFTILPKAIFLNSGSLDTSTFQGQTSGVPVLGSLPANAINAPAQQFSAGVGGEIQMTTQKFGIAVGYTPYQFLVQNITGRFRYKAGSVTFFADRDSVKDTQLSYAGLRDPGSITPVFEGNIWGGVISTGGGMRLDFGDEHAGFYASFDGSSITGYHVLDNRKYEGTAGAYFRVHQWPGIGSLNVGGIFFGEHYDHNERGLTYGQGGYFSPNAYFLAGVPITFNGFYGERIHYVVSGAVGIQSFQEDSAPFYPLPSDIAMQNGALSTCATNLPSIAARTCTTAYYPANADTGMNFDIGGEGSYRFNDHWYIGGFFKANNTNNYTTGTIGGFVRYTFKKQFATEDYPTGLFPIDGFRPLRVP